MREFHYDLAAGTLLSLPVINKLCRLKYFQGENTVIANANAKFLETMHTHAKNYSIGASNRLSGIQVPSSRIHAMLDENEEPKNQQEQEYLGYTKAFTFIKENYTRMDCSVETLLTIHRLLFAQSDPDAAGHFKTVHSGIGASPEETPHMVERIVQEYTGALAQGDYDPVLLFSLLYFDFVMIHPFDRGNGRVSRLLALHALSKSGYPIGMFVSMESILEQSLSQRNKAIQESAIGWPDGTNDYQPICHYALDIILFGSQMFRQRIEHLTRHGVTKSDRIRQMVERQTAQFSKGDILAALPGISEITVRRELIQLQKDGVITKLSDGRYSEYIKNTADGTQVD